MPTKTIETDVLIVGAGPTGLALANALGVRGIDAMVIDRDPGVAELPRAVSVDDEAMRFMQNLGLIDATREVVLPGTGTKFYGAKGQLLAYARGPERARYGHPVKNPMDHPEFQQMLLNGLDRFAGIAIHHETELVGFEQDDDGVTATIKTAGGEQTVRSRYMVGCDGGASITRTLIGEEPMSGSVFEERWLVIDTVNDPHDQRYAMHYGDPARPRVVVVGRDTRCRYEFLVHNGENPEGADLIRFAQELVAPFRELDEADIVRCTIYKFYALVADGWSQGRVYLAGDAAHMMPPFAGQGMNSGLRDAFNLSWKLAAVLDGQAGEELLATYESERRPHVSAMVQLSVRMGEVMMTLSRMKARIRDLSIKVGRAIPGIRRFFTEMRFKPPAFYGDGFFVPARPPEGGATGTMLVQPRVLVESGEVMDLDTVIGADFALLAVDLPPEALVALSDPIWDQLEPRRVLVRFDDLLPTRETNYPSVADADGLLEEQLGDLRGQLVLVRPDRFIAGSFKPGDERAFAAELGQLLGASTAVHAPVEKVA